MTTIIDRDVAESQALFKARFGIDLDYQTARKKLSLLVRQMELIYKPIKKK